MLSTVFYSDAAFASSSSVIASRQQRISYDRAVRIRQDPLTDRTIEWSGSLLLDSASTLLHWTVDQHASVLHTVFFAVEPSNPTARRGAAETDSSSNLLRAPASTTMTAGFAFHRITFEFGSVPIAVGVTRSQWDPAVVTIVWVGADGVLLLQPLDVQRAVDGSEQILVQCDAKLAVKTRPLSASIFTQKRSARMSATVLEQLDSTHNSNSNRTVAAVIVTDGFAMWAVEVSDQGELLESRIATTTIEGEPFPPPPPPSTDLSSHEESSVLGINWFRGWGGKKSSATSLAEGGDAEGGSHLPPTAPPVILGLAAVPSSTGFVAVGRNGVIAHYTSYQKNGRGLLFAKFPLNGLPLSNNVRVKLLLEQQSGVLDLLCLGLTAAASQEVAWWFRSASGATTTTAATMLAMQYAPISSMTVKAVAAHPHRLAVMWATEAAAEEGPTTDDGSLIAALTPVSVARLSSSCCTNPFEAAFASTLLQILELQSPTEMALDFAQLYDLGPSNVSSLVAVFGGADDRGGAWLVHHIVQGAWTASLLHQSSISPPDLGFAFVEARLPVVELAALAEVTSSLPSFVSAVAVPIGGGGDVQSLESVLLHEGLDVLSSHVEAPQTFARLLADIAVSATVGASDLSGYHELAAGSFLHGHALFADGQASSGSRDEELLLEAAQLCTAPPSIEDHDAALQLTEAASGGDSGSTASVRVAFHSRYFVGNRLGSLLLQRLSYLVLCTVGAVARDPLVLTASHVVESLNRAVGLLVASLRAVRAAGSSLVAMLDVADRDDDARDVVTALLGLFLNEKGAHPAEHVVWIGGLLLRLPGTGPAAAMAWAMALQHSEPAARHFIHASAAHHHHHHHHQREGGSLLAQEDVARIVNDVTQRLEALAHPDAVQVLAAGLLVESFPASDHSDLLLLAAETKQNVALVYRAAVLRRVLAGDGSASSLCQPEMIHAFFLPDLLRLCAASQWVPTCVTLLLLDVYAYLATRSVTQHEDFDAACFDLSQLIRAAPASLQMAAYSSVQSVLQRMIDMTMLPAGHNVPRSVRRRRETQLLRLTLNDPAVMNRLSKLMVACCLRGAPSSSKHTADRSAKEATCFDHAVLVYRFLMSRHAYGDAARAMVEVATLLRRGAHVDAATLGLVEHLLMLAVTAAELIPDVPEPTAVTHLLHAATEMSSGVPALTDVSSSQFTRVRTSHGVSPVAHDAPMFSSSSSASFAVGDRTTAAALSRQDLPWLRRRAMESTLERLLLSTDHHVDTRDAGWGEEVNTPTAAAFAQRLLRSALAARLWDESLQYAAIANLDVTFVLQTRTVDLLEDPRHAEWVRLGEPEVSDLPTSTSSSSSSSSSSSLLKFDPHLEVRMGWQQTLREILIRCTPDNTGPLQAAVCAALQRNYRLVPRCLKDALEALHPSALIHLLLGTLVATTEDEGHEKRLPGSLATEALVIAARVWRKMKQAKGQPQRQQGQDEEDGTSTPWQYLTGGIVDRCVALAHEVRRNAPSDSAACEAAAAMIALSSQR